MICEDCGERFSPLTWDCMCTVIEDDYDYDPEDDFLYGCYLEEEVYPYCPMIGDYEY